MRGPPVDHSRRKTYAHFLLIGSSSRATLGVLDPSWRRLPSCRDDRLSRDVVVFVCIVDWFSS